MPKPHAAPRVALPSKVPPMKPKEVRAATKKTAVGLIRMSVEPTEDYTERGEWDTDNSDDEHCSNVTSKHFE